MKTANQFLKLREQVYVLEAFINNERAELEERLAPKLEQAFKLREEKTDVNLELIKEMEDKDVKSFEIDNKLITRQSKSTFIIDDAEEVDKAITDETAKIKKLLSDKNISTKADIINFVKPRKLSNANVKLIADRYFKIEGKNLKGIEIHETKFLRVKDKNI